MLSEINLNIYKQRACLIEVHNAVYDATSPDLDRGASELYLVYTCIYIYRNSGNRVSQQRRKKGQQRNPTQNNRQQRSRPQERNSNRNTENNRRVRNNNRTSKDNDRSTGRSNYNRRPFLGQGRYSNPNQT